MRLHPLTCPGLSLRPVPVLMLVLVLGLVLAMSGVRSKGEVFPFQSDFPFQASCVTARFPEGNVAYKGLVIRLGTNAAVCFDMDLLRMSAGWTGGYITPGVAYGGGANYMPRIIGRQRFGTRPTPGWADADGSFTDPRKAEPFGPLPEAHARWDGVYVNGQQVLLRYTVLGARVEEQPLLREETGRIGFVRSLHLGPSARALTLLVCDLDPSGFNRVGDRVEFTDGTNVITVKLAQAPSGVQLKVIEGGRVVVTLPPADQARSFEVVMITGEPGESASVADGMGRTAITPATFHRGGPAHWPQSLRTNGVLATSMTPDGAYAVDRISVPMENPWNRSIRFGGIDFFEDGRRAALCTWEGDVWIVSGLDDDLAQLSWRRFASGQFETLGLKIVDEMIYTSGRDQITRYHDLNNDGAADYYENFNNQVASSAGFHEFQFDLQTDPEGNFYTAKGGPVNSGGRGFGAGGVNGTITSSAGTLQKISPDGKRREIYATGFRAPNGIGVGPEGQVTTGDNEGTWVPQCPINWIKQGSFCGVETLAHADPIPPFTLPLCWMSKRDTDNSSGGQVWVTSDRWGPYEGELLHLSYGMCRLYHVLKQEVDGVMQGGVVWIPVKFTSSAMRARFSPLDGQLYVCGLRGWQTSAGRVTGVDRVRYTGKPVASVVGFEVTPDGVKMTFGVRLDSVEAEDPGNYSVRRWNYRRTSEYGSPEYSTDTPPRPLKNSDEREEVIIQKATLSGDGLELRLVLKDLKPVMQQSVRFSLETADGLELRQEVQHTIHRVPTGRK